MENGLDSKQIASCGSCRGLGVCLWLILCDGEAEATFRKGRRGGDRLAFILGVCQLRGSGICSGTGGKEEEEKEELSKIEREMEGGGRGERLREEYGWSCENVRGRQKMRGMFFCSLGSGLYNTKNVFIVWRQASKEVGWKEQGQTPPESYTPLGVENSQCCGCKNSGFRENHPHLKGDSVQNGYSCLIDCDLLIRYPTA